MLRLAGLFLSLLFLLAESLSFAALLNKDELSTSIYLPLYSSLFCCYASFLTFFSANFHTLFVWSKEGEIAYATYVRQRI